MYAPSPDDLQTIKDLLPARVPLFVLELALLVVALVDLLRRPHVRGGNKAIWIPLIVLVGVIGPIIYLTIGRKERTPDRDQD